MPPPPCPANFPTSRQVEKLASRHTPPTTKDGGAPAYRGEFITPPPAARSSYPGVNLSRLNVPPCIRPLQQGSPRAYRSHLITPTPSLLLPRRVNQKPAALLLTSATQPWHPAPLQLSNFPTNRKVEKSTSWQVGKHRHLPLHHQPVPAASLSSSYPRVDHHPASYPRVDHHPAALCPPLYRSGSSHPLPPPYPRVNQETTYCTTASCPRCARRVLLLLPPGRPNPASAPPSTHHQQQGSPRRNAANPPPCIPAALAASFSLTPPVNQCPPAPSPLLPPRERSPSYPGVNQPHLCYTTHQRETPALRSPPPDPPHPVITQQPCARRCIVPVHHTTLPPLPTAPTLRISPSP